MNSIFKFLKNSKFTYDQSRYADSFLSQGFTQGKKDIEKKVYCFWTGNNPLSENRARCLENMRNLFGKKLTLITPENIHDYVNNERPLHSGYEYLSLVHKSDYLRCYFMHHFGGGYSDIKFYNEGSSNWDREFEKLSNSNKYALGYGESSGDVRPRCKGTLGLDMCKYWTLFIGTSAFIFKPNTPFTYEWWNELNKRMDKYLPLLQQSPGNERGDNEGYPIPWTNILGDITHPLCLKYSSFLLQCDTIKPNFKKGYR